MQDLGKGLDEAGLLQALLKAWLPVEQPPLSPGISLSWPNPHFEQQQDPGLCTRVATSSGSNRCIDAHQPQVKVCAMEDGLRLCMRVGSRGISEGSDG